MTEEYHYDKLVILNNIYHRSLTKVGESSKTLLPHQSGLVQEMHRYREKMLRGYMIDQHAINGKIGILGDQSGTGKTRCMIEYLAAPRAPSPRMTSELSTHSTKYFFSHEISSLPQTASANLVIVPQHLFASWQTEMKTYPAIRYVPIETKRGLRGDTLVQNMRESAFVLATNKSYKAVQEYADQNQIIWDTIVVDEASSIHLHSSDPPLRFQFLWLMTSHWIPLLFKHPSIIKSAMYFLRDRVNLHPELEMWLLDNITVHLENGLQSSFLKEYLPFFHPKRSELVLRCSKDILQASMNLPIMTQEHLQCRPNVSLASLTSFYLARSMEPTIRTHQIPHLFQALNVPWMKAKEYLSLQKEDKVQRIQRKINDNECVICLESSSYPTILDCCHQIYCGKCILRNMLVHPRCPTCREGITPSNLCCLGSIEPEDVLLRMNKTEICMDLFKNNRTDSFIVYSSFDNIYYQMFEEMDKLGIKAERLENNVYMERKTIRNFQEGKTKILFVSQIESIRGMSFPKTSHLIFFHELPVSEWKEVLIHSMQRLGRTKPLKILYLHSEIQV
uniref:RING-type domain-containing protein n=1 Tax=viral metagenome TaxID=1070528 RepID=A0A6C0DE33_9ZZZZ